MCVPTKPLRFKNGYKFKSVEDILVSEITIYRAYKAQFYYT